MSGAWGLGAWGLGGWGGAAPLAVASAFAVNTRAVRVTLTAEPLHASLIGTGDALNPATWSIQRLDTGALFTVLAVNDPGLSAPAIIFDVIVLENFAPHLIAHRVTTTTLISAGGGPVGLPNFADFDGVAIVVTAPSRIAQVDLRNDQTPSIDSLSVGGTLQITSAGDYGLVQGIALLKKLIIRRLTTRPGAFKHLPNYGLGLRAKEPFPTPDLTKLKAAIERAVLREPEVNAVRVRLEVRPNVGLFVNLLADVNLNGANVTIPVTLPSTQVSL